MALPKLKSPDGKITRVVTSQEELDSYEEQGWKRVQRAARPAAEKPAEKPSA